MNHYVALTIEELHLYDNRLIGTIPNEIGSPVLFSKSSWTSCLENFASRLVDTLLCFVSDMIYLDGNDFYGSIPSSFGYLRNLGKFRRSDNYAIISELRV